MKICYEILNEIGLVRKENQDNVFGANNSSEGIFLVADGMGGHTDGGRASRILKDRVEIWWENHQKYGEQNSFFHVLEELKVVLEEGNQEIFKSTGKGDICGSTVVLLWIQGYAWAVLSCGDSRCYLVKDRMLVRYVCQVTTDDVWENQLQNVNGLSREEIQGHACFGRLVHAVGTEENFVCTVRSDQLSGRSVFALCSDGIYRYCPEKYLRTQLKRAIKIENLKNCTEKIKHQVYRNSAPDNLSFILIHVSV